MSNLNKIKEEGEVVKNFGNQLAMQLIPSNETMEAVRWARKELTEILKSERDKAYSLAIDEVVEEIEEMSTGITINSYTELVKKTSYLEALDSLKQKLLSLKNK